MNQVTGDLWDFHAQGHWVGITTNTTWDRSRRAVMGRGVALQAAKRFPDLPILHGRVLMESGGQTDIAVYEPFRLICYPVKAHWRDPALLWLIRASAASLRHWLDTSGVQTFYMVRPGCGNGGLEWDYVAPVIRPYLDERVTIVNPD